MTIRTLRTPRQSVEEPQVAARNGGIEHVGDRGLVALCNPYRLDGRVSTHPVATRGWAPMNVYVLREGDDMMVIDSGFAVHREAVLDQLGALGAENAELSLLPFHYGELNSNCNFGAIAERFGAARVLGNFFGPPHEWLDFRPGSPGVAELAKAQVEPFPTTGTIDVAHESGRQLATFIPPVWLLPYSWAYDAATRTLFTADMFAWAYRATSEGPWIVDETSDETTTDDVWKALCTNLYWWLPGARTGTMRQALAATFEQLAVETIAPVYGCVLHGREVVDRHVRMLDEVLERAAEAEPRGAEVASWRFDEAVVA